MKKTIFLVILMLALILTACGGNDGGSTPAVNNDSTETNVTDVVTHGDERTLNYFVQIFLNEFELQTFNDEFQLVPVSDIADMEKPFYPMIGAIDGVIFYIGNSPVTIYEFEDADAIEQAFEDFPFMEEQSWIVNGRFVIESPLVPEASVFFGTI